jgi:ferredoxin
MITNTWRTAGSPVPDPVVEVDPPPAVEVDTDNVDPEEQAVSVTAKAARIPAPTRSRRRCCWRSGWPAAEVEERVVRSGVITISVLAEGMAGCPTRQAEAGTLGGVHRVPGGHMKVVVDYDECASNAVCMGIAPEVFEVRDDGFLYVLNEHPGEDLHEKVRQAANGCPTGAITIVEDE